VSKVFFIKTSDGESASSLGNKAVRLIELTGFLNSVGENDFIGIKTHFGEEGNLGHIDAGIIARIAGAARQRSKRTFVVETNTLYAGSRSNAAEHSALAERHGFTFSALGVPVIIADGLKGRNFTAVRIDGRHLKEVKIASDVVDADILIVVSHITGHMQCGFGGAIKNIGMGCASRAGKLEQHSNVIPSIAQDKCKGCRECAKWCPAGAVCFSGGKAHIEEKKCIGCGECTVVCKNGAVDIKWSESVRNLQEKIAEYALGVCESTGKDKMLFINFLTHVTKDCDCMAKGEAPVCKDVGIMLSCDPVALDKASVDMITNANKKDIFKEGYPEIDWMPQLSHGKNIGLGSMDYELESTN